MNLATATVAQILVPVDDFEKGVSFYRDVSELWLAEFKDPDGNQLALMAELPEGR